MVSNNASYDGLDLRLLHAEVRSYQSSLLSFNTISGGPTSPFMALFLATHQRLGALPNRAATRATYSKNGTDAEVLYAFSSERLSHPEKLKNRFPNQHTSNYGALTLLVSLEVSILGAHQVIRNPRE